MPAVLSDRKVCHPHVPLHWLPVLEDLVRFQRLESQLREHREESSLRASISELHDRLVETSDKLLEPQVLDDLTEEALHTTFARAVFLLMRIAASVAGDDEVLDTAHCRTLHLYESDFIADPQHQRALRQALRHAVTLSTRQLTEIEAQVYADTQQAVGKHDIVRAIRDEFDLWQDSTELRQNAFAFFTALYGDVGITADEVELIITGTMVFFCLPFHKDVLTTSRFQDLTADAQQPIRDFLTRVNRFSQYQFSHFPVFGFLRGRDLDPSLLARISRRSGFDVGEVARELSTLTAIVPLTELEKYVVHDIWGHSWQACMLGFDDHYVELARYADALDLDHTVEDADGSVTLADCFAISAGAVTFDKAGFDRFVDLEIARRLPIAMTPVLAEVLADVAEFKLLATGRTEHLASTSVLNTYPAKLDLTLRDVVFYFRQATKVFRLLANKSSRQDRLVAGLCERGARPAAARAAVDLAVARWQELEACRYAPELQFEVGTDSLQVNVLCRLALNFLAIHRETLLTYGRLDKLDVGHLPLKGFRDLLLIAVAVFFESAPGVNLWRVDEFLSTKVEPLCLALARRR